MSTLTASTIVLATKVCPKAPPGAVAPTNEIEGYVLWGVGLLFGISVIIFGLLRLVPGLYGYVVEHRIYSLYGQLRVLEGELEEAGRGPELEDVAVALEELSRRASHLSVPLMFSQRLFILKSHIALAQAEVEKRRRAGTAGAAASPPEQRREVSWPALPRGR